MKKLQLCLVVLSLAAITVSCGPESPISSDTEREEVPDAGVDLNKANDDEWQRDFEAERSAYRSRLDTGMMDIERRLEETRTAQAKETDKNKLSEYDSTIRRTEAERNKMRDFLNRLETQTEETWQEFKQEVDEAVPEKRR